MIRYTFTASARYCSTEIHKTAATCHDCTDIGTCAGCEQPISDGTPHKICDENGEPVHPGCEKAATARWVDYY